jgi:hypothetical protein
VTHQNVRRRELGGFENSGEFGDHCRHSARREPARAPTESGAIVTNRTRKFGN